MGLTRPRAAQIYNLDYKQATRVVTVVNITLAGGTPNQVDGVNLTTNDRILVTGQSTASENGLYDVDTVGSGSNGTWVRTSDGNETGEIDAGMIIMVTEGAVYADTQWKLITDNPITIGSTALIFTQNYSANSISGGTSNVTVYSNANVTISSAGTPNVLTISSTGTVTTGTASVTGNITGDYILGNGSQLTGITVGSTYGNSNVQTFLESGSLTGNIIPNGNAVYSLGNLTNQFKSLYVSNNTIYIGGTSVGVDGNTLTVAGELVVTANATGTSTTAGNMSVTGSITSTALTSTDTISATGNVTGGNILTSGSGGAISGSGNITAGYFIGNGSVLTSLTGANITGTVANATYAVSAGTATSATTADTVTTNAQPNITSVGTLTSLSSSGNITSGNILTAGLISSTGNSTAANYLTGGNVSVTGNITGGNLLISGSGGALSGTGNITAGNLLTTGLISATGNVTTASVAGGVITGSSLSVTGTQTAASTVGGVITGSSASVTGNVTGANVNTGGNVTGNWLLPTTGMSTGGNVLVGGYISVVGNIYASNIVSQGNLVVTDPLVYFQNTSNYPYNYDIGFYSAFTGDPGNTYQHTGLTRSYVTNSWSLFSNVPEPAGSSINLTNAIYDPLRMGALTATTGAFSSTVSATGNITGGNISATNHTGTTVSITGTTTAASIVGGVMTGSSLSVSGNVNAGNVIVSGILVDNTGNLDLQTTATNGNINLLTNGTGIVATSANVTAGNISATNHTGTTVSITGSVTAASTVGGVITGSSSSVTGNVTGGNVLTGGIVSATGNITGGNLRTAGLISTTGTVTANNFIGSGTGLTALPVVVSNDDNSDYPLTVYRANVLATASGNAGSIPVINMHIGSIKAYGFNAQDTTVGGNGISSLNGISAAANIVGGNILTGGIVSATGNVTGAYFIGNGSALTGIAASGGIKWTTVANTAPSGANAGDFWYNSYSSILYQYTNDGTGNIWVDQSFPTTFSTISVTGNIAGGNLSVGTGTITGGNLSVGTGTITGGNIVNSNANGVGNIGSATTYFNTAFVKATSAQYADLAEMYSADTQYTPGTVVEFGGTAEVTISTESHSTRVAGIVSTNPSYLMNSALDCTNAVEVALTGRVPCRVVGTIRKGDRLVSSNLSGVAMVLNMQHYEPGCIIGKALEDYDSTATGVIEVAVGRY